MLHFQAPGKGTGTPVHKDGPDNLVLQLQGVKRWTIFPPSDLQAPRAQLNLPRSQLTPATRVLARPKCLAASNSLLDCLPAP